MIETYFAAQAALDRDVTNVYVVRYHFAPAERFPTAPRKVIRHEHLRQDGGWHEHNEGDTIQPALSIPGWLVHQIDQAKHAYPNLEEQAVMRLLAKVMESV